MSGDTFLLITIIGFGIQQFVQVLIDPLYTLVVGWYRGMKRGRVGSTSEALRERVEADHAGRGEPERKNAVPVPQDDAGLLLPPDPDAPPPDGALPALVHTVPGGRLSEVDSKKFVLGVVTIGMAAVIVESGPDALRLLTAFKIEVEASHKWLDYVITVLVMAAGTEGANSILKLLQYAKQAVKERTIENPATQPRNLPRPR